jgi:hypothetical protein
MAANRRAQVKPGSLGFGQPFNHFDNVNKIFPILSTRLPQIAKQSKKPPPDR